MLIVLKYGGNAMAPPGAADVVLDDICARVRAGDRVVLVHGGGPQIDAALAERRVPQRRVAGLRITDAATLAVTESVLCGTVNKALVRRLASRGCAAVGISGQDGNLLLATPHEPVEGVDLGFVGDRLEVNPAVIVALLDAGFVPVVAPLARSRGGGGALNVNADNAAGALAGALRADCYLVLTNVERVRRTRDDPATGIAELRVEQARRFLADGTFDGGMIPKIESALDALEAGAAAAVIGGTGERALERALAGEGTRVVP